MERLVIITSVIASDREEYSTIEYESKEAFIADFKANHKVHDHPWAPDHVYYNITLDKWEFARIEDIVYTLEEWFQRNRKDVEPTYR